MRRTIYKILKWVGIVFAALIVVLFIFSLRKVPTKISYGVSFSVLHSEELKLPWKEVYQAILDDLKVKKLRLSAHWTMVEPEKDQYNFEELDYQIREAEKRNAKVILAIGRRLPGWPECHEPGWAWYIPKEEKQKEIAELLELLATRYKDSPALEYWQVENEPFLGTFADYHCGKLDKKFLKSEIELVRKLDPAHKIVVTDSGEFGFWYRAYNAGDIFGTTMYLYVTHHIFGDVRYPIRPGFFKIKQNLMSLFFKEKPMILIELALEPWLTRPITEASMEMILDRMSIEKVDEIITFASKTGFDTQYLWGAEWWYWMRTKDHPEFWNSAKTFFAN